MFVDSGYVIALVNHRDDYHTEAMELAARHGSREFVTTDAVLIEIGNALARGFRSEAWRVLQRFRRGDVTVVAVTADRMDRAIELYATHDDKTWGLADCLSFVVMRELRITEALTFDRHFAQAGFIVPPVNRSAP